MQEEGHVVAGINSVGGSVALVTFLDIKPLICIPQLYTRICNRGLSNHTPNSLQECIKQKSELPGEVMLEQKEKNCQEFWVFWFVKKRKGENSNSLTSEDFALLEQPQFLTRFPEEYKIML